MVKRLNLMQYSGAFDRFNFAKQDVYVLLNGCIDEIVMDDFVQKCWVEAKILAKQPCTNPGFIVKGK